MRGDENPWMVVTTGVSTRAAVGEREKVEMVVDEIELASPLEYLGNVQTLPDLGIQGVVFGIGPRTGPGERRLRDRVGRGEQGDGDTARKQPSVKSDTTRSHGP